MDRAPKDFRIKMNGVWVPTDEELSQLQGPREDVGPKVIRYIDGRGAGVRLLLGDKQSPTVLEVGKPFFVYIYAELRGRNKALARRTARIYPERQELGFSLFQEVREGKYSFVDLKWIGRPLTAFEFGKALRKEADDLFRASLTDGPEDRVFLDHDTDKYVVLVDGQRYPARSFDDALVLADYLTSLNPDVPRNDWRS